MCPAGVCRANDRAAGPAAPGFTLIEVLVVLLLVGILASLAVLAIRGHAPREIQRQAAHELLQRMDFARREAVMQSHSLGIRFSTHGYRFFTRRHDRWEPLQGDRLLAQRRLAEPLAIDVDLDGLKATLGQPDDREQKAGAESTTVDDNAPRPQIFFLAGGEIVPGFSIRITSADTRTRFRIAPGDERWLALTEQRP